MVDRPATTEAPAPVPAPVRARRANRAGILLLALALYALLIDAAVETYQSTSALGPWVALPVALYVSFSLWLWRNRRQGGPGALTSVWVSSFLFLALLAYTANQVHGLTDGVRVAGYPTPVVLNAATVAVIGLALWSLAVTSPLPLAARIVAALAACYGLAAFGIGLATHRSYADLLQGHSVWERLPYWLQGAFVGTLLVLPLALALEIGVALARVQLSGRKHRIVFLALGIAMAYAAFSAGP